MLNNEYLKILKDPRFSDINVNFIQEWYTLFLILFNSIINNLIVNTNYFTENLSFLRCVVDLNKKILNKNL
jgi:hypothetical protein